MRIWANYSPFNPLVLQSINTTKTCTYNSQLLSCSCNHSSPHQFPQQKLAFLFSTKSMLGAATATLPLPHRVAPHTEHQKCQCTYSSNKMQPTSVNNHGEPRRKFNRPPSLQHWNKCFLQVIFITQTIHWIKNITSQILEPFLRIDETPLGDVIYAV